MEYAGHEIWIEGPDHGHLGSLSNLQLKYGRPPVVDGRLNLSQVTVTLVDPFDHRSPLVICSAPEVAADAYVVSFMPMEEGLYTVAADYQAGIWCTGTDGRYYYAPQSRCPEVVRAMRYSQFSKAIVPVGHGLEARTPEPVGQDLEILVRDFKRPAEGDSIIVEVVYQKQPLAGAILRLSGGVDPRPREIKADRQGRARVMFDTFGLWILTVAYDDFERGVPGEYDAARSSAMLTIKVHP